MKRYCLLGILAFLFPVILVAADAKNEYPFSDFMRVTKQEGKKTPASFDTAIAKFTGEKNDVEVHLIGAVHIGDKDYYTELNEIFKRYDALLYELVAEEGVKPSVGNNEPQSFLSVIQSGAGSALALEHQLKYIDYRAKNMIHADLDPAEFARRFADRGDLVNMFFRMMILGIKKSGGEAQKAEMRMQGRLLGSFFAPDPTLALKRVFAEEMMGQLDDAGWIIGGDGSAIITDRNTAALKVLSREIKNGKKKIAIFYGAAHLPEFAKSLEKDFDMKYTGTDWVIAWDLTKEKSLRRRNQ